MNPETARHDNPAPSTGYLAGELARHADRITICDALIAARLSERATADLLAALKRSRARDTQVAR